MSLYDSLMGSDSTTNEMVYTVPDAERTVIYPDKEFTNVLGTVYLPRIYGKELSYLELGSSGKIAVTLTDIHSFDIANSNNVVYFNATNAEKFALVPKDAEKTVSLGEFSSFSSNNYQQFDTTETQGFNFLDNVRFNGNTITSGNATVQSDLLVNGNVDVDKTLQVTGEVSLSNNLNVQLNLDVNGIADVQGTTILRDTLQTVGAASFSNTVYVAGDTTLESHLQVNDDVDVTGTLQVTGEVSLSNNLNVQQNLDVNGTADILGATILRNDAQVVGAVTLSNTLLVEGNADLNGTLDVLGSTLLRDTLQTVGATSLSNTLNVVSTTTLQSNLIVNGGSLFQLDSKFNSTVTISNLVVTDTVSFTGGVPSVFENLTVNGTSVFNGLIYTHADVGMSNNLTVAGNTDIKTNLLVEGSTQLVGPTSLSNVLNVDGVSTFNNNVIVGVSDAGVNDPTKYIGIGTASPNISLDLGARTDGIALPVGNTAARPTGEDGIIRYNSEINRFEGYGNAAWSGLGGVVDVNQDTYILAENTPNANNDQLRFFTNASERMIILSTGNVGVGATTDPTSGNTFWVQGNSYFSSTEVRMNNNLAVEQTATIRNITATHDSTMQANLTVNNTLFVDSISDPTVINVTAPTINLNGNVAITGSLETINTETITVEDRFLTLCSLGQASSNIYNRDGGLNTGAGLFIEGIPDGFDSSASNVKYYEKSLTWNFGGSNGVASLAQSTNALDDCYYSFKNGSLLIERYSSNFGMNYVDGSSIPITTIGFMFRINSNEALEVVKVKEDANGVRTAAVVSRFGIQLPALAV